ncbi:MAG: helix-turn-helix transcriptional regulator [Xanthobacteraceae bacterium]
MELTGNHLKAARAIAGLDQAALAELAGVSINTIRNMEATGASLIGGRASTRDTVQAALERLGVEFANGGEPGVRLRKGSKGRKPVKDGAPKAAQMAAREIDQLGDKSAGGGVLSGDPLDS